MNELTDEQIKDCKKAALESWCGVDEPYMLFARYIIAADRELRQGDAQAALAAKDAEIQRMKDTLAFVERWANYHAQKPGVTAAEALSRIQHYPEIEAITESYADGKVPEARDPYAEIAALKQRVGNALALWATVHAERSEAMIHGARLDAEIAAPTAERDALLKDAALYRFVVSSTDHSVAKWHDYEGWYAIEEVDLDADMQAQAVKS